jgi:hypothetical protein
VSTPAGFVKTILLKGNVKDYDEGYAAGNITPGMLVEPTTAARDAYGNLTYQQHSTAKGFDSGLVVIEDVFQGGSNVGVANAFFGGGIDDAIPSGKLLRVHKSKPQDELYMFVKASAGAVSVGNKLCSAGNGQLQKWTGSDANPNIARWEALEAVANSGAAQRIRVRRV